MYISAGTRALSISFKKMVEHASNNYQKGGGGGWG